MRESARIAHVPESMTFEQAAPMCDGALNALWCLRLADLEKRPKVLIYGASGAIGTAAVQLARHFKADVTAVCNTKNLELIKSIGAGRAIDSVYPLEQVVAATKYVETQQKTGNVVLSVSG